MPDGGGAALERARLEPLLETLLPGNNAWPSAAELGLADAVVERVGMAAGHEQAIARLLDALPDDFADGSADEREAALSEHEGGADFGAALLVAYDAYYVQQPVLELLQERCGYVTRPPQPEGFKLEPFDESRLARQREREPFWRQA